MPATENALLIGNRRIQVFSGIIFSDGVGILFYVVNAQSPFTAPDFYLVAPEIGLLVRAVELILRVDDVERRGRRSTDYFPISEARRFLPRRIA